jgi:hypothetical protein
MGQPDAEHPTQGRPFDGKLDAQPPSQLLTLRSILRSFSSTDSSPAVGDVPRDTVRLTVLRVTARGCGLCGLATGFGAWTVMLGRAVASERGSVRDIAVPLSNTVDRTARAEGATRLDDILITRSLKSGSKCRPRCGHHVTYFRRNDRGRSAVRYRASIRVRYLFRFSAVTRNFPPFSMPVQYHHDRFRSQPRNILVSTHCA